MMVVHDLGVVALVVTKVLPWPALLTLLAVPLWMRTLAAFRRPKPTEPPGQPGLATVVGHARIHTIRRASTVDSRAWTVTRRRERSFPELRRWDIVTTIDGTHRNARRLRHPKPVSAAAGEP
jgi:hypothetical protein